MTPDQYRNNPFFSITMGFDADEFIRPILLGEKDNVSTSAWQTLWQGNTDNPAILNTAQTFQIVSGSTNDASAGTGANTTCGANAEFYMRKIS